MMRLLFIWLLSCSVCYAQNILPIAIDNNNIIIKTYSLTFDKVNVQIDTGAKTSIVFRHSILRNEKQSKVASMQGVGGKELNVRSSGIMVVVGITTTANYIDKEYKYDAILGLDWMLYHKARIDLNKMILEYD